LGGVRRFIDEVREAADEWQVEINAIESAGEGRVLLRGRSVLVSRESGMAMEKPLGQLFHLKDGCISRVQTFRSREQALEATGLRE